MTDEKYLKLLGKRVFELRSEKGWTQAELAEKIKTQHTQVRRIEKGQVNSTINMLRKLAKAFNKKVSELVNIE
jgi:transcriptional regulator with XRE-family HTH domain